MLSNIMRAAARSFSSTSRVCSSKLYEFRIYSYKVANTKAFIEHASTAMPIRYRHSPGLGYFFSEIGGLGEAVHIWEYESYADRAECRKKLAADPSWTSDAAPMLRHIEKQENCTIRLYPWSTIQTEVTPGGFYFLYIFTFKPGLSSETISEQLESFIKDADLTALGAWREELGKNSLRNAYALFHSSEFDSGKNPALASVEAWNKLNQYTSEVHGRVLSPAQWSSYQ